MGVYINYSGNLDDPARLDEAIAWIKEWIGQCKWPVKDWSIDYSGLLLLRQEVADEWEEPTRTNEEWLPEREVHRRGALTIRARVSRVNPPPMIEETHRGVIIEPPETGSMMLLFSPRGRICYYVVIPAEVVDYAVPDTNHYMAFTSSVCTSGEQDVHLVLCAFLSVLKEKWMSNLRVEDSSGFYETADLKQLALEHGVAGYFRRMMRDPDTARDLAALAGVEIPAEAEVTPVTSIPITESARKSTRRPS